MSYKLATPMYGQTESTHVIKDGVLFIPFVNENTDYQEYLEWVAEGNTPEPADPLPTE